jgi:hypothetical protein
VILAAVAVVKMNGKRRRCRIQWNPSSVKYSPVTGGNSPCTYDTLSHISAITPYLRTFTTARPPLLTQFVMILREWRNMPESNTRRSCGGTATVFVNLSVTPQVLYPRGKGYGIQWIGDWVDPRVGLDAGTNRKVFTPAGNRIQNLQPFITDWLNYAPDTVSVNLECCDTPYFVEQNIFADLSQPNFLRRTRKKP